MEEKRGQSVSISRKSKFQTFGEEVYLTDLLVCPVPRTVHRQPICCTSLDSEAAYRCPGLRQHYLTVSLCL
ncbi:hypothetical protein HJG60_001699 [Phyllostomus discolor]|uniref:Uncharacterized protein n=1 Tax=Phyllostomus discolor TaxID=89673 RepID=A0A833YML3_9CHIR|nr:hypothetical protein HJG60_001699 [Phyllostomus discolor]